MRRCSRSCSSRAAAAGSGRRSATTGVDNDQRNGADCEDPRCGLGALCGVHGVTCAADRSCSACSGNGGAVEDAETICGDGFDNDCDGLVDCADRDCQPTATEPGRLCGTGEHRCTAPDHAGRSTCGPDGGSPGTGGAALGTNRFVEADLYLLGTRGSGYQEQAMLTFAVTRQDGAPYAGLPVTFEHLPQGGSFVGVTPACAGAPATCRAEAVTDASGRAHVLLTSGEQYAVLSVRATAEAQGLTRSITAGGFTVVGAKPNGAHISLDCDVHNVPALTHHDCLYSNYCGALGTVRCTVKLADRFGAVVGVPTEVAFRAEAGAIPPVTVTKAFDITKPAASQQDVGHGEGYYEVCNSPLPFDVPPLTEYEYSYEHDWGCGRKIHNPRDGLVTLVAMVLGEEGYVDTNLNGTRDAGEPFIDLPEPFVDVDDDGVRDDPDEWFLDVDDDGVHDGPNGTWDANTVLWTQTRMLYTGYPVALFDGSDHVYSRFHDRWESPAPPEPTPPAGAILLRKGPPPTSSTVGFWFTDENLNPLTSETIYGVSTGGAVSARLHGPYDTPDSIGTSFRQLYCESQALDPETCRSGPAVQGCVTAPC